ncbi:MAG: YfhO family protein, partial [Chloroflexota bacterium]|nr:YfhO family protein [Chloroflexota bacterium]
TVRVDGQPAPLLRADVLFRAVPLPAGDHTVEFRYRSLPLERGLIIAAITACLTMGLAVVPGRRVLHSWPGRT